MRRSAGLHTRVIGVRAPERREVPAEVQFEVAPNTVTDITNLRSFHLRCQPPSGLLGIVSDSGTPTFFPDVTTRMRL